MELAEFFDLNDHFEEHATVIRSSQHWRKEFAKILNARFGDVTKAIETQVQLEKFFGDFQVGFDGQKDSGRETLDYFLKEMVNEKTNLKWPVPSLLAWLAYNYPETTAKFYERCVPLKDKGFRPLSYRGSPGDRKLFRTGQKHRINYSEADYSEVDGLFEGDGEESNPSGIWRVNSPVFERSEQRYISLRQQFFGRSAELQDLDDFIAENDRGLLIVSGPAGSGKSALLAKWIEQRSLRDNYIAYHFISNLEPRTTGPDRIRQNLVDQIEPRSNRLSQSQKAELYSLLTSDFHTDEPLILVVDGLDESSTDEFEPFLECFFGARSLRKNVYVVVSARHEKGMEQPSYISHWHARHREGLPGKIMSLPELGEQAICDWLRDKNISDDERQIESLAKALLASTDGLPLFLTYVIQDLEKALPNIGSKVDQIAFIQRTPRPFTKYVAEQLSRIRRDVGDTEWQRRILPLLATLGVTKSAISRRELAAFLEDANLSWEFLPLSVKRWLAETKGKWSFAHPKLAQTFSEVVGLEPTEICDKSKLSPSSVEILDRLVSWMEKSWADYDQQNTPSYLCEYLFDWFPEHLASGTPENQVEAARLLTSLRFLHSRLSHDTDRVSERFARHCDLWNRLPLNTKSTEKARQWTAFLAQNEARLRNASKLNYSGSNSFIDALMGCLGDAQIDDGDVSPRKRAIRSHPIKPTSLIRSIDHAHLYYVEGVRVFGKDLVSWGNDGAIRFWDSSGQPLPDHGDGHAHSGLVSGVMAFGEGLVSWGWNDGAIRFWDAKGRRMPNHGDKRAHLDGVGGVIAYGDGLVSWGWNDGAIRFWDATGQRLSDRGDDQAHPSAIVGVMAFGEGLVSWSYEGAIRFWDATGKRIPEKGDDQAHLGGVTDMMAIGKSLVSCGGEGAIRFWDSSGQRLPDHGDEHAHSGYIFKLMPFHGGLVGWGREGAIRFWDAKGRRLIDCGDEHAHQGGIIGVMAFGEGLISWGEEGAIRFWDATGKRLTGRGDDQAHSGIINGVMAFGERLVSWGGDGAIRFWDATEDYLQDLEDENVDLGDLVDAMVFGGDLITWGTNGAIYFFDARGQRLPDKGDEHAHSGAIFGVMAFGERLVSWGGDGAIRFWDSSGQPLPDQGDGHAHSGMINGVMVFGEGLVSWGDDGAIWFWDATGKRLPDRGDDQAHSGKIEGVMAFGEGLVSWGHDGAIRFWNAKGQHVQDQGDEYANSGGIRGVRVVGDCLASLDEEGATHFWDASGRHLGTEQMDWAIINGVMAFGGDLITWEQDGAIRFWDATRHRLPDKGEERAHSGEIRGVMAFGEGLVSWGYDGAVLFWDATGKRLEGRGDEHAHSGYILEVVAFGEGLVSWGDDGAIRLWNSSGLLIETIVPPEKITLVRCAYPKIYAVGKHVWVYEAA